MSTGNSSNRPKLLSLPDPGPQLTHYFFRYPAKFHAPVVRTLLAKYTSESDVVLDPFCGSGTLLVEASVAGRSSIGYDVDPIAVAVTNAKVQRSTPASLGRSAERVLNTLARYQRPVDEYTNRQFTDLTEDEYDIEAVNLSKWIPAIPNLFHWFRRYVIIDLAYIRRTIELSRIPETHKQYLRVVFISILRNASNADPVPVSGLEVTKWMKERDAAGRVVNPFELFAKAASKAVAASSEYLEVADRSATARAYCLDATQLHKAKVPLVDAIITSPPYHGAVDYYRRHQLEMFWLGSTNNQAERLDLLQKYIGRPKVPARHPWVSEPLSTSLAKEWEERIRRVSPKRANAFRHYMTAMMSFFNAAARKVKPDSPIVLVIGRSSWNDSRIPTPALFGEICAEHFELDEEWWYPIKNRYMSYTRHNGADISKENVLVFRRMAP